MARSVPEWIPASDDSAIPDRVRLRVYLKYGGRCQCGCNRQIRVGESWDCDHDKALVNGGEHREGNLRPLLTEHHRNKTKEDVAEKALVSRKQKKHLGIKKAKGTPMPGTKRSRWKRRMDGTIVPR